ncbi:MFS transporter [Clostridium estertheticum]|uniref:MFS transporter n=1 Tax=Clostridium estertheticum TaxID=238834 RepID=UPI001CF3F67D|nr:MFS transporter [Clostridium estertheticum]MCB2307102.1 MFS transporter [Clostridium estertheticum]MCB2347517.1 MFS transporter [Clostridium estertheticum]MCB2350498.1 MFS transporter [Clostridium estertheticum]WAG45407.1 MFS transporter [Clostridium estertheticum]
MLKKSKKITLGVGLGYGLTDAMGGGAFTIIGAFLLFFYITFAGLSPLQAASIIAIARLVDAIVSLSIGSITDNFYKTKLGQKFGRRRFFLLIGVPLMAVYATLWVTGMGYLYYLISYLLFEMIAAMILIPYETLPSEMTKDFNERTVLSTGRMFISATSTFFATFVPGQLIKHFGQNNPYAYFFNGCIFAVVYAICIFITYKVTWEREPSLEMKKELLIKTREHKSFKQHLETAVHIFNDYISTFKIRSFRKHLAIYILSFTAKDVFNATFIFFCVYDLKVTATLAANLLSLSIVGIPVTILAGFLMIKVGPSNLFKIAYSTMIVCLLGFYAVYLLDPASKISILFIISIVYQIGVCILIFAPWNVFPFIPDVDEMVFRKRREGLFAAVMTFTRKSSVAVATLIVGLILEYGGFVKGGATQTPQVMHVIAYTMVIGSIVLLVMALLVTFTFKLNKQTHIILTKEIERLKNNGSKLDVDPKTKEVVEDLTGYKYEDVWKEII